MSKDPEAEGCKTFLTEMSSPLWLRHIVCEGRGGKVDVDFSQVVRAFIVKCS